MKHLFTITVLLLAVYGRAFADPASDQRELTQLVKDLNAALVKADIAFLQRVLHKADSLREYGSVAKVWLTRALQPTAARGQSLTRRFADALFSVQSGRARLWKWDDEA
jgi:hypothetical protein